MKWYSYIIFFILFHSSYAQFSEIKYEGDDCILKNNEKGTCTQLSQCSSAIKIVENKQHPVICGYNQLIPVVCCPIEDKISTRISEQKCAIYQKLQLKPNEEYLKEYTDFSPLVLTNIPESADPDIREIFNGTISELNVLPINISENLNFTDSGISNSTDDSDMSYPELGIIGGTSVLNGEFPHMAALGFVRGEKILWQCGGSLISEKFVLTAAHCLSTSELGKVEWVSLGSSFINLRSNESLINPSQEIIKIIRRIPHPLYKRPATYHDIAIVELERSVEFNINLKPVCLHVNDDLNFEEKLIATGWGLTEFGGSASENLLKVKLDIYSGDECAQIYEDMAGSRRLMKGIDGEGQMCAGGRNGQEDTCSGDSGGPLQLKINDTNGPTYLQIGVTSFGKACGILAIPGVYTRVSKYVPWIESIVWSDKI